MKYVLVYGCATILGWWLLLHTHVALNKSASLPYHAFFCIKGLPLKRGTLVHLKGHDTAYTQGLSFIKTLLGLPGDFLEIQENTLLVNGQPVGLLRKRTQENKRLTPLTKRHIPKGFVFVGATHPRSFDSRYTEFGLVAESALQSRCFGLCKRSEGTS